MDSLHFRTQNHTITFPLSSERTQQMLHICRTDTQHLEPKPQRSSISLTACLCARLWTARCYSYYPQLGTNTSFNGVKLIFSQAHVYLQLGNSHVCEITPTFQWKVYIFTLSITTIKCTVGLRSDTTINSQQNGHFRYLIWTWVNLVKQM